MARGAGAAILVMLLGASSTVAAELALPGNYGNAEGCAYLKTNDYGNDAVVYLTPQSLSTFASSCDFVAVHADSYGNQLTEGICHSEGEETLDVQQHIVTPTNAAGAIRIYSAGGEIWAELEPCS